jgi:hypothetical protein
MRQRLVSHLTLANVGVVLLAFVVLGGGAYATFQLPRHSVGRRQLKKDAVVSSKVKNRSLLRRDFKAGQLPVGAQGPTGATGPQGPQGLQGQPGQDATKLFAFISDGGANQSTNTAGVVYGSGVSSVTDPSGDSAYTVTFNRSLQNCVVEAEAGTGDPIGSNGSAFSYDSIPTVSIKGSDAQVRFLSAVSHNIVDSSFMITAFC